MHFATFILLLTYQWAESGGWRPVVITTNYDVNLEGALLSPKWRDAAPDKSVQVMYPGSAPTEINKYFRRITPGQDLSEYKGGPSRPIEVIKLHGSVNWFVDAEQEGPGFEMVTLDVNRIDGRSQSLTVFRCQEDAFAMSLASEERPQPLIVPPLLGKTSQHITITCQWARAVHALRNARHIIVAGYSFPETDLFMSRLLAEAICDNNKLERIIVVNPDARRADWRMKIMKLFNRSWCERQLYWIPTLFARAFGKLDPGSPREDARKWLSTGDIGRHVSEICKARTSQEVDAAPLQE